MKLKHSRLKIWRSPDLGTTSIWIDSRDFHIDVRIRARLNKRGRRAIALPFFRQIRPWLENFEFQSVHHIEECFANFDRSEERGLKTFKARTIDTPAARFGYYLRIARLESGFSQGELARRCGVNRTHLSKIEQGLHVPRWKTIRLLEKALKTPLDDTNGKLHGITPPHASKCHNPTIAQGGEEEVSDEAP